MVSSVLDDYFPKGFLSTLDSTVRRLKAMQTSLNVWACRTLLYFCNSYLDGLLEVFPEEPSEASFPSYVVVMSAVVLLALVYQYLMGNVDRGGSKAYSHSSLDVRDICVSIVLFLGTYVWIKFREVAPRGVYHKKLRDKQGRTKVVYDARLTPPMWNGENVPKLELGRFATLQEAHNMFLIAAFYYDRAADLLDGWFQIPPMSEEEQRHLTGKGKRDWVLGQANEVYKDFKKEALWQKILEASEDEVTPEQDEVNVDPCGTLNPAEPQQHVRVNQAENSGMGMAMIGKNHGLERASHSCDGMLEGLALSNGLGSQEGSALPVSRLPRNTEGGMSLTGSDQLDLFQTLVRTLQQQISLQQQQIQGLGAQILQLEHQQRVQQQQLQEPRIQNPQWSCQLCLQEQQLQDANQGVSVFEMEMERSILKQNYLGLMTPLPDGGEAQEGVV